MSKFNFKYILPIKNITAICIISVAFFVGCGQKYDSLEVFKQYEKYGIKDKEGNLIVKCSYDMIYPFDEKGYAIVNSFGGKYGVIDANNKIILDIVYDYIGNFEDGRAVVKLNGKLGYVNERYEIIVKPH